MLQNIHEGLVHKHVTNYEHFNKHTSIITGGKRGGYRQDLVCLLPREWSGVAARLEGPRRSGVCCCCPRRPVVRLVLRTVSVQLRDRISRGMSETAHYTFPSPILPFLRLLFISGCAICYQDVRKYGEASGLAGLRCNSLLEKLNRCFSSPPYL